MQSVLPLRMTALAVALYAGTSGVGAFSLTPLPLAPHHAATSPALAIVPRTADPAMAAPQARQRRQKPRDRKKKMKEAKQKVKVAPTAAALQLTPERTFWEGAPSITETLIPGLSVFTVVGVIPFGASIARQAWTRYKVTNKRLEVASGFQGKDIVQISWREVDDVKWLRRYGGACGDIVFTLRDGAKIEVRSMPEFDRNLAFIVDQLPDGVKESSEYPDVPAKEYMLKVEEGEEPPPTLDSLPALEPSSWKSYMDSDGKTYYANEATGETSWSLPEGGSVTRG